MLNKNQLMNDLRKKGFSIQENVFDSNFIKNIKKDLKDKILYQAGIGNNKQVKTEIRSDKICWLEENDSSEYIQKFFSLIKELKTDFNKNFFLGIKEFEGHFAQYESGDFYKAHKDNLRGSNNRVVTIILYLNEDWKEEDGGKLRLHVDEEVDVEPKAGSIIAFMSEEILHEVLPSNNTRQAITGWLLK